MCGNKLNRFRRVFDPFAAIVAAGWLTFLIVCGDSSDPPAEISRNESPPSPIASTAKPVETALAELPSNQQESWQQMDDPGADGWDSEVLAKRAGEQLDQLGALFFEDGDATALLGDGFVCDAIVPPDLENVFEDETVRMERSRSGDVQQGDVADLERTLAGVKARVTGTPESRHLKFKVTRVVPDETAPEN